MAQDKRPGLPELPEWEEFRKIGRREDRVDYLIEKIEWDVQQGRDRDHWFANQLQVVFGNSEVLHEDLLGNGTHWKPGILNTLLTEQEKIGRRQEEIPKLVKELINETKRDGDARSYSSLKKWMWGTLGAVITAAVTGLTALLFGWHP